MVRSDLSEAAMPSWEAVLPTLAWQLCLDLMLPCLSIVDLNGIRV